MVREQFILGEEKNKFFEVRSRTNRPVVITDASYSLMSNGKALQEGKCIIEGQKLSCMICPPERGCMYLEIQYVIPPETRKARIEIEVV